MKGDTVMKRPTDKEIRLYSRLSEVDGDLILDSAIPQKAAPSASGRRGLRNLLARPQAASVAIFTLLLALTAAALLITGIMNKPHEAPPHGTHSGISGTAEDPLGSDGETEEPGSAVVDVPTYENAAALRKGMSLSEMREIMGDNHTIKNGRYTFTLDTGEVLAVDTAPVYGGDVGFRITGFEWLGETAKAVNPMDIPAEILQKLQDYAADRVIPVYTMVSLFKQYESTNLPSADEVLEGAELHYLRTSADGETALLDEEGHGTGGSPQGGGFSFLTEISALFDESVRVKGYYPILTSMERGAVYFRTSIGDYILYLHGEGLPIVPEGSDTPADWVPYLIPVAVFHRFARDVVSDQFSNYGVGWIFLEKRVASIEPYRITAEGYQKPVNLATPEAAEQVTVGSHYFDWAHAMGMCLGCARRIHLSYDKESGEYGYASIPSENLHYWELTDGRGFVVGMKMTESYSGIGNVYEASVAFYTDSADVLYEIGKPSTAVVSLLRKDMSCSAVNAILGTAYSGGNSNVLMWHEDGLVHTCTVTWSTYKPTGTVPVTVHLLDTYQHSTETVESVLSDIQVGVSYASITARLGDCLCGHEANEVGSVKTGYHFWALPDGRCLAVYMGYNIPVSKDPFGFRVEHHFPMTAMHLLWLDSVEEAQTVGTPGLSRAQSIETGMDYEVVEALMGQPTATVSTLASIWEWSEGGKVYTCTVYLQNNIPEGLFLNFDTVTRCEIVEGALSSLPIPDKEATPEDAARITEGMTASQILQVMGSRVQRTTLVDAELYCWALTDGRVFCALAEGDVTDPLQTERVVTYTFYRDSMEDVSTPTQENMEAVTEGMSAAIVVALLGQANGEKPYIGSPPIWVTTEDVWWELEVEFETVTHPETNTERAYVKSVTLIPE